MIEFLTYISNKFGVDGIIQVGSNTGQECNIFRNFTKNIICFEPVPQVFQTLQKNNTDIVCYNFGLGDKNETKEMNIASNNSESSSFLKPLNHLKYYNITFNQILNLEIKRFDSLGIDLQNYNVLISDTQGYEINVLKGFGELVSKLDAIIIEYINSNLYEGDTNLESLEQFLKDFNFSLSHKTEDPMGWGNAYFIKK